MTDNTRILTEDESYLRRAEDAAGRAGRTIALCAETGCPRAASWGPWCGDHRPPAGPRIGIAHDLTPDEYTSIRAEVEAKAAPLFLIAMDWLTTQQLAHMGIELGAANQ